MRMRDRSGEFEALLARQDDPAREIVLTGAHVVTMDDALGELKGDVRIVGDRIAAVGPGAARDAGPDAVLLDLSGGVVLPGLVDTHVHAWEGALRGVAPEADFNAYMATAHGRLAPLMTPEDVAIGQRVSIAQALNGGVTTIVDNSHNNRTREHADAAVEALRAGGIRAVFAASGALMGEHDGQLPGDLERLRDTYFRGDDQLTTLRMLDLSGTVAAWRHAAELGLGVCVELGPWIPGLDELLRSGLAGPSHTYNHATGLSAEQWKLIADTGATVSLVPRSDSYYGIGAFTPVLEAQRYAVPAGLSTDNELSYGADVFAEMRMLLAVQRALSLSPGAEGVTPFGPRDVLRIATAGGAHAAGLGDRVGVLAPGRKADLTVLNLDTVPTRPWGSLIGAVVNYAGIGTVDTVLVDGRARKLGGHLVDLDYDRLVQEAEASRERLLAAAGIPDGLRSGS